MCADWQCCVWCSINGFCSDRYVCTWSIGVLVGVATRRGHHMCGEARDLATATEKKTR